jgi:SAM-dependent methyltransferase
VTHDSGLTAYDVADRYDDEYFADLAGRYRNRTRFARRRIANVRSLLPPLAGCRFIDLGTGMGTFAIEAAREGAFATGIDLAPAALAAARRVAASERIAAAFVRADGALLPIRTDSVDVVVAADLTEHLDDVTFGRVLREVRRALKPGGTLVLYTPNRAHIFEWLRERNVMRDGDPSHIGLRSEQELADAVHAAGLRVQTVRRLPSHLPVWNILERVFSRWIPFMRRRIGLVAKEAAS